MGATKRTEHICKISPILQKIRRCRRTSRALFPEVTPNHVQALFQGLIVLECQNNSPSLVAQSTQPQLISSTENFINRFRSHRSSPHPEDSCPGCRGIRQVVSLSSFHLAQAIRSGDRRGMSLYRGVVERLHDAWEGPPVELPQTSSAPNSLI